MKNKNIKPNPIESIEDKMLNFICKCINTDYNIKGGDKKLERDKKIIDIMSKFIQED